MAAGSNVQQTLTPLQSSLALARGAGDAAGAQLLDLSDLYKRTAQHAEALEHAKQARLAYETLPAGHERDLRLCACLSRIAQAGLRLQEHWDTAMAAAAEGLALAVAIDDVKEQAGFRAELARLHLARGELEQAAAAADEALALARRSLDARQELACLSLVGSVMSARGQWTQAREVAMCGHARAVELKSQAQVAEFLIELARIDAGEHDIETGLARLAQATRLCSRNGLPEGVRRAMALSATLARQIQPLEAGFERLVAWRLAILPALDAAARRDLTMDTVLGLKALYLRPAGTKTMPSLLALASAHAGEATAEEDEPNHAAFIAGAVEVLVLCAEGKADQALPLAERLDTMSAGGFRLAEFVRGPGGAGAGAEAGANDAGTPPA